MAVAALSFDGTDERNRLTASEQSIPTLASVARGETPRGSPEADVICSAVEVV